MTIVSAAFSPGEDVHLLPGMISPQLDQLLVVDDVVGSTRTTHPFLDLAATTGLIATFAASFNVTDPRTAGIAVSPVTGEVIVSGSLPSPERLLDFLVIATVYDGASVLARTRIRVRIHDGLRSVWLTPDPLAVRRLTADVCRLSILAEFDDGQHGDLTNWAPFATVANHATDHGFARTIAHPDDPIFRWDSSNKAAAQIDPESGRLTTVNNGTTTIDLTSPTFPTVAATATVAVTDPWNTAVDLHLVEGPGLDRMEDASNVLLLPEGFTEGEQGEFERIVRQIVHRLRARRRTRPFDLLKDRINYCRAWVDSPDAGVTVLDEIEATGPVTTRTTVRGVSTRVDEAQAATEHHVGRPAQNTTRFLLNERSTAFHVALGGRPSAAGLRAFKRAQLHDLQRIAGTHLDDFFAALRDPKDPLRPVGTVWMRPSAADPLRGKDEARVVFVCRCQRTEGAQYYRSLDGRYICVTLCEGEDLPYTVEPGPLGRGIDLVPDPIPPRIALVMPSACAHEICHSFSLGDEYGSDSIDRNQAAPLVVLPAARFDEVRTHPNLHVRADLLTNGSLDPDRIRWRWPRISKAGVLAGPPGPPSANGSPPFRLLLEPGHAPMFAAGDVVRLRRRPLIAAGAASYRLRITGVDGDTLVVEPDEPTPNAETQLLPFYLQGTLVMAPVRQPDAGAQRGDDVLLVHEIAMAAIGDAHNPLNALPWDGPNRPCTEVLKVNTPTAAMIFLPDEAPRPPRQSGLIVGLYENGAGCDAEVYRPTGMCFMRTSRTLTGKDQAGQPLTTADQRLYQRFCPVCRYVLVDLIDPTQHGRIDRDYGRVYPR